MRVEESSFPYLDAEKASRGVGGNWFYAFTRSDPPLVAVYLVTSTFCVYLFIFQ